MNDKALLPEQLGDVYDSSRALGAWVDRDPGGWSIHAQIVSTGLNAVILRVVDAQEFVRAHLICRAVVGDVLIRCTVPTRFRLERVIPRQVLSGGGQPSLSTVLNTKFVRTAIREMAAIVILSLQ